VFLADNQFLSQLLHRKGINHQLHVWADETHAPPTWQHVVELYL